MGIDGRDEEKRGSVKEREREDLKGKKTRMGVRRER